MPTYFLLLIREQHKTIPTIHFCQLYVIVMERNIKRMRSRHAYFGVFPLFRRKLSPSDCVPKTAYYTQLFSAMTHTADRRL